MVHGPQDRGSGYGTPEPRMVAAEQERYRRALGVIHDTATVAAQCPCCLLVAGVARDALTPPLPRRDYWRYCEA